MENVNVRKLPIAGRIQHGKQIVVGTNKKVKELGYFITNINNDIMDYLGNRFSEKYPKDTKIKIRIVDENPFVIRQVRYNQGGTACFCMKGETQARQKVSNKLQRIECSEECEHRKIPEGKKKPACNREGKLYYMIPEISEDTLWYSLVTSKTAIERVEAYLDYLKQTGNSLIGDYTLYIRQEPQTSKDGECFNNYILGIYKDNLDSSQTIPKVENSIENKENEKVEDTKNEVVSHKREVLEKNKDKKNKDKENNKTTSASEEKNKNKTTKSKETNKKDETNKKTPENTTEAENIENYYALVSTSKKVLKKDNKDKEYVVGSFVDNNNNMLEVFIKDEFTEELLQCDIGTLVELELINAKEKIFANNLKYIQKCIKNVAA